MALIYTATVVLIGVFVGIYRLLVRPKSLGKGLAVIVEPSHGLAR